MSRFCRRHGTGCGRLPLLPQRRPVHDGSGDVIPAHIQHVLDDLQYQLSLIEALKGRNRAQLDSFVNANDQCVSLSADEKALLNSKDALEDRLEEIIADLINSGMGWKSLDGRRPSAVGVK